ncbi:hypothetical protein K3148_11735 [Qipengyuania aurantiaca]|uniref:Secreted protein n=1 Tax=Qipengyuania aurantiaca TaxID=2867233 RepID=A0ABX8ZKC3_9SPHN|nr:hypothetical protein [Qipengyuania aurantiaca]QZD89471.1 hypothetical protein K3148_11735 [Qipengyuania aurantiaca]
MKNLILAGAAALAFTAVPAAADHHMEGEVTTYQLGEDQVVIYEGWPEDRRVIYDAWPYGVQEYYWTLEPAQTEGWWVLTDPQRVRIYEMTPDQRAMAWQQINAQMSGDNNASTTGTTARTTAATTTSASPRFVRSEVTQTTPAGYTAAASGDDLPVCTPNQQDGCINSWEKNKTGNRPLEYWPGRPASEIDGPLPATQAEYDSMNSDDDDDN